MISTLDNNLSVTKVPQGGILSESFAEDYPLNILMPEMDGFEATWNIRQMVIDQPYIIAMTANVMSNDREECLQNGMNDYISKPFYMNEVINKLKIAADYCNRRG